MKCGSIQGYALFVYLFAYGLLGLRVGGFERGGGCMIKIQRRELYLSDFIKNIFKIACLKTFVNRIVSDFNNSLE